jgi:hypothetical protein
MAQKKVCCVQYNLFFKSSPDAEIEGFFNLIYAHLFSLYSPDSAETKQYVAGLVQTISAASSEQTPIKYRLYVPPSIYTGDSLIRLAGSPTFSMPSRASHLYVFLSTRLCWTSPLPTKSSTLCSWLELMSKNGCGSGTSLPRKNADSSRPSQTRTRNPANCAYPVTSILPC